MADKKKSDAKAAAPAPETADAQAGVTQHELREGAPGIHILAQYLRDFSFENPRAPDSLRGDGAPKIDLDVELAARSRADGLYEIDLKLTIAATRAADVVFHVELLYGGLFQVEGIPAAEMEAVLLIECPRFLFPFARRIIADMTAEGGFPPFRMDPIDFAGIYMARKAQQAAGGGGDKPAIEQA